MVPGNSVMPRATGGSMSGFRAGWLSSILFALSVLAVGIVQSAFRYPIQTAIWAGLPIAALGLLARNWEAGRRQQNRDRMAGEILDRIGRGESPRFSLYLRTFGVTGELPTGQQPLETVSPLLHGPILDFETLLAEAVEPVAPLVGLGQPGEHLGAGRIRTDDTAWQDFVLRLATRAELILVIPSGRPGTAWELKTLAGGDLWKKSVYLMPPGLAGTYPETWNADRARLAADGVSIPEYSPWGMAFALDSNGAECCRVNFVRESTAMTAAALRESIERVRAELQTRIEGPAPAPAESGLRTVRENCPKCGGTQVRQASIQEMEAELKRPRPKRASNTPEPVVCAKCGTEYLRKPPQAGALVFFIVAAICSGLLFLILNSIVQNETIQKVRQQPRLNDIAIVLLGVAAVPVLGFIILVCVYSGVASLFPKRQTPGRDLGS
jgi:hypothetical protein